MILAKEFKGLVRGWLAFVNVGVDTLLSGCHTLVSRSRVRSTHHFLLMRLRVIIHNFTHQLSIIFCRYAASRPQVPSTCWPYQGSAVLADPIFQAFRKQRALPTIRPLNKALHSIHPCKSRRNHTARIK
jgi:hypothetical protein